MAARKSEYLHTTSETANTTGNMPTNSIYNYLYFWCTDCL